MIVCGPLLNAVVFHDSSAETTSDVTCALSMKIWIDATPMLSLAVAVTVTVPDTVALFAGVVICVVGGVMSVPVPVRLLLCVPALSVTVTVAVRAP